MRTGHAANKLERIAETIGVSLTALPVAAGGTYEQTASGDRPRKAPSGIDGLWTVMSHTVGGVPYAELFADAKLGKGAYGRLDYDSTFEFTGGACVKRMRVTALLADGGEFEYSLTVAFACRPRGNRLEALPLAGYQATRVDGEVTSLKELPGAADWLRLEVEYGDGSMTISDGDDVKTLARADG